MSTQLDFNDIRPDHKERLSGIQDNRSPISLILDGLTDQKNIGGIFRTADAARIKEIILYRCPIELNPKKISKTARSTQQFVNYRNMDSEEELIAYAKKNKLVSVEYTSNSTVLSETEISLPVTLVLGNERLGVSEKLLELSDQCVHLPMLGIQTSLNVCTAGSIAIYEVLRRL